MLFTLKASRFGELRNNNDPLLTFEGDNNVLIQQTSNHLISVYEDFLKTRTVPETPLRTSEFLNRFDASLALKFTATNKFELLNKSSNVLIDWLLLTYKAFPIHHLITRESFRDFGFFIAIMQMFDWLIIYQLKLAHSCLEMNLKCGKDLFAARNDNQVFVSKTLSIIFIEVSINIIFWEAQVKISWLIWKMKLSPQQLKKIIAMPKLSWL